MRRRDGLGADDFAVCDVHNEGPSATLTVVKHLFPDGDRGRFDLLVNGEPKAEGVGHEEGTRPLTLALGTHKVSEQVTEKAAADGLALRLHDPAPERVPGPYSLLGPGVSALPPGGWRPGTCWSGPSSAGATPSPWPAGGAPFWVAAEATRPRTSPMPPKAWVNSDGHDEDLVGFAFGQLGEHLQVFVAQELPRGAALVDRGEDRVDRLGFALGLQHGRLLLAFGPSAPQPASGLRR